MYDLMYLEPNPIYLQKYHKIIITIDYKTLLMGVFIHI